MALLRNLSKLGRVTSQVVRLQTRKYADVPTELSLTFASPSECFYNTSVVKQVDVPSLSGSFGILVQHVPTIAVLKPGVVSVHEEEGAVNKYFVSSGSVTVNADSTVQILAEEATPLDRLDMPSIKEGLQKAQQEMNSAQTDVAKAEAQITVECYEELQKALE